jgi:hypothetical protein
MGRPDMAAHFREEFNVPFTLLVDHTKQTYRALDIQKGSWWSVMGPPVWLHGIRTILQGKRIVKPEQDPFQLGALAFVEPGGELRFVHRSTNSNDNLSVDELVAKLR